MQTFETGRVDDGNIHSLCISYTTFKYLFYRFCISMEIDDDWHIVYIANAFRIDKIDNDDDDVGRMALSWHWILVSIYICSIYICCVGCIFVSLCGRFIQFHYLTRDAGNHWTQRENSVDCCEVLLNRKKSTRMP